jgi:hypothetical protein
VPDFTSPFIRSAAFCAMTGIMSAAATVAVCTAGVSAVAAIASLMGPVIITAGTVVPPLIDQWQRVRIIRKVLDTVDDVDDAVKLLQALAPSPWPVTDTAGASAQRP